MLNLFKTHAEHLGLNERCPLFISKYLSKAKMREREKEKEVVRTSVENLNS